MSQSLILEGLHALRETVGIKGLEYELKVYDSLIRANVPGLDVGDKPAAGFSNQGAGDIEASYFGKPFNVEIKLSSKEQMGGTSFRYDMDSKEFIPVGQIDQEDLDLFLPVVKEKARDIDNYIKASWEIEPKEYHKMNRGVPIKVSKEAREILKRRGLTSKIATNIKASTNFITKHYNKKGVYYINVGGAGLFYMGRNPLNLPVPELRGEVQVELGLRFGGGKLSFPTDPKTPARSAGLRIQGRMLTRGRSKYNLDNPNDVIELFANK